LGGDEHVSTTISQRLEEVAERLGAHRETVLQDTVETLLEGISYRHGTEEAKNEEAMRTRERAADVLVTATRIDPDTVATYTETLCEAAATERRLVSQFSRADWSQSKGRAAVSAHYQQLSALYHLIGTTTDSVWPDMKAVVQAHEEADDHPQLTTGLLRTLSLGIRARPSVGRSCQNQIRSALGSRFPRVRTEACRATTSLVQAGSAPDTEILGVLIERTRERQPVAQAALRAVDAFAERNPVAVVDYAEVLKSVLTVDSFTKRAAAAVTLARLPIPRTDRLETVLTEVTDALGEDDTTRQRTACRVIQRNPTAVSRAEIPIESLIDLREETDTSEEARPGSVLAAVAQETPARFADNVEPFVDSLRDSSPVRRVEAVYILTILARREPSLVSDYVDDIARPLRQEDPYGSTERRRRYQKHHQMASAAAGSDTVYDGKTAASIADLLVEKHVEEESFAGHDEYIQHRLLQVLRFIAREDPTALADTLDDLVDALGSRSERVTLSALNVVFWIVETDPRVVADRLGEILQRTAGAGSSSDTRFASIILSVKLSEELSRTDAIGETFVATVFEQIPPLVTDDVVGDYQFVRATTAALRLAISAVVDVDIDPETMTGGESDSETTEAISDVVRETETITGKVTELLAFLRYNNPQIRADVLEILSALALVDPSAVAPRFPTVLTRLAADARTVPSNRPVVGDQTGENPLGLRRQFDEGNFDRRPAVVERQFGEVAESLSRESPATLVPHLRAVVTTRVGEGRVPSPPALDAVATVFRQFPVSEPEIVKPIVRSFTADPKTREAATHALVWIARAMPAAVAEYEADIRATLRQHSAATVAFAAETLRVLTDQGFVDGLSDADRERATTELQSPHRSDVTYPPPLDGGWSTEGPIPADARELISVLPSAEM
jgi:hypothetical protein